MDILSTKLISLDDSIKINEELAETFDNWRDGVLSSYPQASAVKKNQRIDPSSEVFTRICSSIKEKLLTNPLVQVFSLPRQIHSMMLSKCEPGDGYGWHVDKPFISYCKKRSFIYCFLERS